MKKVCILGVAWLYGFLVAQAGVTLTELKGSASVPGTATFAVDASGSARELWCAWAEADKGTSFADWPANERVCVVPANATTLTATLPSNARKGTVARFFLFPAGQSYAVDYLTFTGSQCIDTGIVPDPTIAISAEFEMEDMTTVQQRAFGVADNPFTVAAYINNSGYWAWGCRNTTGQWTPANIWPEPWRTTITLDCPNDLYSIVMNGETVKSMAISSYVPSMDRTNTGTTTMAFLANKTTSGTFNNFMLSGRFYRGTLSTATAGSHVYVPYVNAGVAGLKDTSTGAFLGNAGTGEFGAGGRQDAANGVAGDLVHLAKLRTGDVWSDATYVFNFDTDLNGDGKVQAGEFRNALRFGSTNVNGSAQTLSTTISDAATVSGLKGMTWKTTDLPLPGRGLTRAGSTYLDLPGNWQLSNGITNCWRNGLTYKGSVTGEVTVVARVLVNNFAYDCLGNSYAIVFNNGLDWNRAFGDEFGFNTLDAKTGAQGRPFCIQGNKTFTASSIRVQTNRWYDVAYSMKNFGNGRCDVTFAVADVNPEGSTLTGTVYQVVSVTAGCFTNETFYSAPGRVCYVGGEAVGGWTRGGDNSGQAAKGLNGCIQRIAVWPRALSRDEIGEAFVQAPPLFRVGTDNGSAEEFGRADETPDAMDAELDPWYCFRGTLTAEKPAVTLNFTLRTESHKVPYVLRVKAAPGTGDTLLAASLNGQSLGSKSVKAGGEKVWFVPANLLKTGAATLRLERKGGSAASIAFDVVELNGSAAIGTANDSNGEFTQEGFVQSLSFAGLWNWKRFQRAVIGGITNPLYQRNAYVKFWVPPELAEDYTFRYTSKITGQGCSTALSQNYQQYGYTLNQWPLTVCMNEREIFKTAGSPNGTRVDYTFEPGELQPGWNTVRWTAHGAGQYWVCMDFHRLEVIDRPNGTILFLR